MGSRGDSGNDNKGSANNTPPSKRKYDVSGTLSDPREKDDTEAKKSLFREQGATVFHGSLAQGDQTTANLLDRAVQQCSVQLLPVGGLVAGRRCSQSLDHLDELGVIRDGGWDVASVEQLSNRVAAVLTAGGVETNPWLNESRVGPRESSSGFIDVRVASLARCVDGRDDLPVLLLCILLVCRFLTFSSASLNAAVAFFWSQTFDFLSPSRCSLILVTLPE